MGIACPNPFLRVRGLWATTRLLANSHAWNRKLVRHVSALASREATASADGRVRLSKLWIPSTVGIAHSEDEDSHAKLIRAGFLRQAHSGIFHMLPLGRRVQDKLEALIDKHMYGLGASKVSLSSISSEELWSESGRLAKAGSELFRFEDRKEGKYLLSPTHEEEITSLVAGSVRSYKQLPVRLYQISRKYRDELRPRHGLLRGREFVMKDLYTFDYNSDLALQTYHQVRGAYARLFDELKLPYLVAEADSGDIGGDLSHEFHFPTSKGEDNVISCTTCDYVANEELAESALPDVTKSISKTSSKLRIWRGISRDRRTLVAVSYTVEIPSAEFNRWDDPKSSDINVHSVKALVPELDSGVDDALAFWDNAFKLESQDPASPQKIIHLVDSRALHLDQGSTELQRTSPFPSYMEEKFASLEEETILKDPSTQEALNLLRIKDGDKCPRCSQGSLKVEKAIELGHTFHLGTRYSEPMGAVVTLPAEIMSESKTWQAENSSSTLVAMQMGCHGIGVSRIIGAVADTLSDDLGLNWPRVMAPYEVVVIPGNKDESAILEVYDVLAHPAATGDGHIDLILDDREARVPVKLKDADLIGYPVMVIVGRSWKDEKKCEVQCRRLGVKEQIPIGELREFVSSLLDRL